MKSNLRTGASAYGERDLVSGIAALVVVARGLGLSLNGRQIVRDNRLVDGELTPADLMRCAHTAGLKATGLWPSWDGLRSLVKALPAIVFTIDGGAMVVVRVERIAGEQFVFLQDPS